MSPRCELPYHAYPLHKFAVQVTMVITKSSLQRTIANVSTAKPIDLSPMCRDIVSTFSFRGFVCYPFRLHFRVEAFRPSGLRLDKTVSWWHAR